MKLIAASFLFVAVVLPKVAESQAPPPPQPNRAQIIGSIFQIPIQTLTAISNLAQGTRPLGEVLQRRRGAQPLRSVASPPPVDRSRAARVAGLYAAPDGSAFRI